MKYYIVRVSSDIGKSLIHRTKFYRELNRFERQESKLVIDLEIQEVLEVFSQYPKVNFYSNKKIPDFDHAKLSWYTISEKAHEILTRFNSNQFLKFIKSSMIIMKREEIRYRCAVDRNFISSIDLEKSRILFGWSHKRPSVFTNDNSNTNYRESSWADYQHFMKQNTKKYLRHTALINFKFNHDKVTPDIFMWRRIMFVSEEVKNELNKANCSGINFENLSNSYEKLVPVYLKGGPANPENPDSNKKA